MSVGEKYEVSDFELKAIRIVANHPGVTPFAFSELCWQGTRPNMGRSQIKLKPLIKKHLIKITFDPSPFKPGPTPPEAKYFLTDFGFEVYEYFRRQPR